MCSSFFSFAFVQQWGLLQHLIFKGNRMTMKALNLVLASAVALTVGASASQAHALGADQEKCYGIVKAEKNDCGSADKAHACAAQAKTDASGQEWIGLPKGLCEKIVGGSLTAVSADAPADAAPAEEKHDDHAAE
jgi:uncharacterized membrane protein